MSFSPSINYDQLSQELDQLKLQTMETLGQKDADYIRRVIATQRICEWSGRLLLILGFVHPVLWLVGVISLAIAKILDNMEIGHNVMHGQYDWMNDKHINSHAYEWDIACDSAGWGRAHNYEHHTYTNIIGKDRDYGYGLLRLSRDFAWRLHNLWQFLTYVGLSFVFQWGVAIQAMTAEKGLKHETSDANHMITTRDLKKRFLSKGIRQLCKDYLLFPLLSGPMFLWVFVGNLVANTLRNLWTSTIIFCGHFTEEAKVFSQSECENESRGKWYYRQAAGSANLKGQAWFHILCGHLSFQIEHHLFPDLPASRYREIAPKVEKIFARHGIHYNSGSFIRQYSTVLKRILRYSFP